MLNPATEVKAHIDQLDRDTPDSKAAKQVSAQLSACIYLQVPEEGGELRLWLKDSNQQQDVMPKHDQAMYGIDGMGPATYQIKPKVGELLLFSVRQYHGVAAGVGKQRINVGLFIGYRGLDQPLSYWS